MNRLKKIGETAGILLCGLLFTASLIPAPEAAVRSSDFLPLTVGWFLLGGIAAGLFLFRRLFVSPKNPNSFRSRLPGIILFLFLGWITLSAIALIRHKSGNPFFAAGQYWSIAGILFFYFILQLFRSNSNLLRRLLLTGLFTVILAESFFAGYCYWVKDPAFRKEYQANPDKILAENGLNYPPGSPERILLENRLLHSTEPLGTYGLTNTLAGFLVPGITFLTTLLFWNIFLYFSGRRQKEQLAAGITALILLIPAGIILLLTKSRSGCLAVLTGAFFALAAVGLSAWRIRKKESNTQAVPRRFLKWGLITIPLLFIGILTAARFGGILDREVFSEAKKSLGYRLDYWRASSRIIADNPIFGVGPGNFQHSYSRYMDAAASEVVADPHNFLFETTALFGIPAGLLLACFILASSVESIRRQNSFPLPPNDGGHPKRSAVFRFLTIFLTIFAGIGLGYQVSLSGSAPIDFDFLLAAFPALLMALPAVQLLEVSTIAPILFLPAALALWVNLLAAGGIFFPACAIPLFLFTVLATGPGPDTVETAGENKRSIRSLLYFTVYLLLFGTACGYLYQACRLNRLESAALAQLEQTGTLPDSAELPLAGSTPVQQYFLQSRLNDYQQSPTPEHWKQVLLVQNRLFTEAPASALVRFETGKRFLQVYQQVRQPEPLQAAADCFAEAAERFPANAEYRAYYGLALLRTEKTAEGESELKISLELDEITPHKDRKLPEPLKKLVESKLAAVQK